MFWSSSDTELKELGWCKRFLNFERNTIYYTWFHSFWKLGENLIKYISRILLFGYGKNISLCLVTSSFANGEIISIALVSFSSETRNISPCPVSSSLEVEIDLNVPNIFLFANVENIALRLLPSVWKLREYLATIHF